MSQSNNPLISEKVDQSVEAFLKELSSQGFDQMQAMLVKAGDWHSKNEGAFNLSHLTSNTIPSGGGLGLIGNIFHYLAVKNSTLGACPPFMSSYKEFNYPWSEEVYQGAIRLILQLNIDINAIDTHPFFQQPPLCHAIAFDNVRVSKALIQEGKNEIDLNRTSIIDIWAATPLILAIQRGHHEIIKILLESPQLDVDKSDTQGLTPLHWAAIMLDAETIELLLNKNANPRQISKQGKIPADYLYAKLNNEDYLKQASFNLEMPADSNDTNATNAPELRAVIAHTWNNRDGFNSYLKNQIDTEGRTFCMQLLPQVAESEEKITPSDEQEQITKAIECIQNKIDVVENPKIGHKKKVKIKQLDLPDIPSQIDLEDLDWYQSPPRLLEEKSFHQLLEMRKTGKIPSNLRIAKSRLKKMDDLNTIKYSVVFLNGKNRNESCFAYYKGVKHGKHMGTPEWRKIKWTQEQETGEWFPVKIYVNEKWGQEKSEYLRESSIMLHLGLFSVTYGNQTQENENSIPHLIMERVSGITLEEWYVLEKFSQFPDRFYITMIAARIQALSEIHQKEVFHRDVAENNIFFNAFTNRATFIDFGLSAFFKDTHKKPNKEKRDKKFLSEGLEKCVSQIKNNVVKERILDILSQIVENNITMNEALKQLDRLKEDTSEVIPNERTISINRWSSLTENEKLNLVKDFSPIDRVTLAFKGEFPENVDEQIALSKIGVEMKRWLLTKGIYLVSDRIVFPELAFSDEPVIPPEESQALDYDSDFTDFKKEQLLKNLLNCNPGEEKKLGKDRVINFNKAYKVLQKKLDTLENEAPQNREKIEQVNQTKRDLIILADTFIKLAKKEKNAPNSELLETFNTTATCYAKNIENIFPAPRDKKALLILCKFLGGLIGTLLGMGIGACIDVLAHGSTLGAGTVWGAIKGAALGANVGVSVAYAIGSATTAGLGVMGSKALIHKSKFFNSPEKNQASDFVEHILKKDKRKG